MILADLTLTCSDGSINLHDVELTESEFAFLGRIADRFRDEDPGGWTPALLVMRAPDDVDPGEVCGRCGETRPVRGGSK